MKTIYKFKGVNNSDSECELAIRKTHTPIVIFTEVPENIGTPINSYFENLATQIYFKHLTSHTPESIIWIEHYPEEQTLFDVREEIYNKVLMDWNEERYMRKKTRKINSREVKSLGLDRIDKKRML